MKKKFFSLLLAFTMLLISGFCTCVSAYDFGYYVHNVEYIGDGKAEATIVFTGNFFGSNADIRCIGVLAVYDDVTGAYLGCSMEAYDYYKPFLNSQRFEVTQTVDLKDLTKERYNFKMILMDNTEGMKPAGFISNGNNCFVMPKEAFVEKDTYYIETVLTAVSIDPTVTKMAVNVTKYDDRLTEQGFGTPSYVGGAVIVPAYQLTKIDISKLDREALYACTGYPCKIKIYMPDYTTAYAEEITKIERAELNIDPQLFSGIDTYVGAIRYYKDAEATTVNTSSKIERSNYNNDFAIDTYINLCYMGTLQANEINAYFHLTDTQKINTNNKNYKFVDRDNNGYYDALFVENSASFIVGKINAADYEIYRDNSVNIYNSSLVFYGYNSYSFSPLSLDTTDDYVSYTIKDSTGNRLSFSDIKVGDILTVAWSFDGSLNYYDITVENNSTINGTISEIKTKRIKDSIEYITYYTINGTEYRINARAQDYMLEPGISGVFKVTSDNRIMLYELDRSNLNYGIVVATARKTGSFSSGYQAQIVTADGTDEVFDFAQTAYINDVIYDTTTDTIAISAGTIVIYETNVDNEIKKIYTTASAISDKENGDVKVAELTPSEYTARTGKIDGKYITENTTIIGIPDASCVNKKDTYSAYTLDSLVDGEQYSGTVVYDAESKEITFAFFTNLYYESEEPEEPEELVSNYGIVVATARKTSSFTNGYQVQIITSEGIAEVFDYASKTYFNDGICDTTTTAVPITAGTVVLYQTNSDGEIKNIYTTAEAIEAKENGDVKIKTLSSAEYTAASGEIDGAYITESTNIIAVPDASKVSDKDAYVACPLDSLVDENTYNGTILYDASTDKAIFAFFTNLYYELEEDNEELTKNYGIVVITAAVTGSFSSGVQAQIVTTNGISETLNFASKAYINDVPYDTTSYSAANEIRSVIQSGTVVLYELNSDGDIRKIYTTADTISDKENGDVKVKNITYAEYTALTGALDGTYITDNTALIGIASTSKVADKDAYAAYPANSLVDGEQYNGTLLYHAASKEVRLAFITNFILKPSYTSTPMVITGNSTVYVDGEIRSKYTGLVDGEEVSYTMASDEDVVAIGMSGRVFEDVIEIGINDVIQFTLNGDNEINSYRHILNYDETAYGAGGRGAYFGMLAHEGNEDNDYSVSAQLYNLNTMMPADIQPATQELYGYAVAGRVNRVSSSYVELFKDVGKSTYYDLIAPSNIIDAAYNPNNIVYKYGATYSSIKTGVFDSVKTFEAVYSGMEYNFASDFAKADDVIYLYSFDGVNVLGFVIDVNSNNK